jgi:hypothetical protein
VWLRDTLIESFNVEVLKLKEQFPVVCKCGIAETSH